MSRRMAALAACGLAAMVIATYLPAAGVLLAVSPIATVGAVRVPTSEITPPLREYTNQQVVNISYTSYGTAGSSGVFWTELYYRSIRTPEWTAYRPPWNPSGRWYGQLGFDTDALYGTIPFDTYYTGGEDVYEFTTIAVDRGYWSEPGPDHMKAKTTLDTHPPDLFVATPVPGTWTNQKILKWVARDAVSGVATVNVSLDGGPAKTFTDATGQTDLALQSEGNHTALVTAKDRAGNKAILDDRFHFDPNAPTLDITAPARDSFVNTTAVDVTWTAKDSGAGIASLRFSLDSNPAVELAGGVTSFHLADLLERRHVISLLATDAAGNIATQTLAFGVDATPPDLNVLTQSGSYVNSRQLQLLWLGSDAISGIDHYALSLDGGAPVRLEEAAGYTFPNVAEASHTVVIQAFDRAGNVAQKSVQVTVDATAPTVTLNTPARGSTVYGSLTVNWTASDEGSGIQSVEVVFDGSAPVVTTGATAHAIASPSVGPHFVIVLAEDKAGNVGAASVPFAYGGASPPSSQGLSALDFWLIMLVIGAIAVVSAYIAVRRRRKSGTT